MYSFSVLFFIYSWTLALGKLTFFYSTESTRRGTVSTEVLEATEICRLCAGICRYGCSTVCPPPPPFFSPPPSSHFHLPLSSLSPHLLSIPPSFISPCSLLSLSWHLPILPSSLRCSLWHTELKWHCFPTLWLAACQTLGEPSSTAAGQLEPPAHNAPQRTAHPNPPPPPVLQPPQPATTQLFVFASFLLLSYLVTGWPAHGVMWKIHNYKYWHSMAWNTKTVQNIFFIKIKTIRPSLLSKLMIEVFSFPFQPWVWSFPVLIFKIYKKQSFVFETFQKLGHVYPSLTKIFKSW